MTRAEIEKMYRVTKGTITSPGAFEAEPVWAPYFWDLALDGLSDFDMENEDGTAISVFKLAETDALRDFPELAGFEKVYIWQDSQGFVRTEIK